jgi:ADP-ribose pyrophosphatase YjhB (NUDIX family)
MSCCPHCGHPLIRRWPEGDSRERDVCSSCQAVHYENPKVLVACLIYWRDRVVLCRRALEPAKGHWYPPTGFVEIGETLEEAAVRELKEETGLELSADCMKLYGVASLPHLGQVYIAYRSELSSEPNPTPGQESLEVRLFPESELPFPQVAFNDSSNGFLRNFFRRLRDSNFTIQSVAIGRDPLAADRTNK